MQRCSKMHCPFTFSQYYRGRRYVLRHPNPFWQKLADLLNWPCPFRSAIKRTHMQDFNSFSIMFYYIISTTFKKLETYFALFIYLDFRTVCHTSLVCLFVIACFLSKTTIIGLKMRENLGFVVS